MTNNYKFNVKTFDESGEMVNDDNFTSIANISKAYPSFTYHTIYYITYYDSDFPRKPSKKISKIMNRFKVIEINNDDMFVKKLKN